MSKQFRPSMRAASAALTALTVLALLPLPARAEYPGDVPLRTWSAPPYWVPPAEAEADRSAREPRAFPESSPRGAPSAPLPFFALPPCRVADTRDGSYPPGYGPPNIPGATTRTFQITGQCAVPAGAAALSANFTATNTLGPGDLRVFPTGGVVPLVSTLNYVADQTVANAAIVPLSAGGALTVQADVSGLDLVLDVNGYYAPSGIVSSLNALTGDVALAPGANVSITPSAGTLTVAAGPLVSSLNGQTNAVTIAGTNGISASASSGTVTVTSNATAADGSSTIVARDASGNFAAHSVTLSGAIALPATASSGSGLYALAGQRFLHGYGTGGTFLGTNAGNLALTGSDNTGVGLDALTSLTSAGSNTAVGAHAARWLTTGGNNSAFGSYALSASASGVNSSAFGYAALSFTTVSDNDAFGFFALKSDTTGTRNAAFGGGTLSSNTIGNDNAGFGLRALEHNVDGSSNTAIGSGALNANTSGSSNTAAGYHALAASTSASRNTAVGSSALGDTTTGTSNTAVGVLSLGFTTTGDKNAAVGDGSLFRNTDGNFNAAIGFNALESITTGSFNVGLGFDAGALNSTGTNNVYVASLAGGNESNTIRIGTVTPNTSYTAAHTSTFVAGISGQTSASGVAVFVNSSGKLGTTTSSRRFKEAIADVREDESALLLKLRPVTFVYRPEVDDGARIRQFGLVAEEVAQVAPGLVVFDADGDPQTVRYHFLVPLLLAELQKQQRTIAALSERLAALERR